MRSGAKEPDYETAARRAGAEERAARLGPLRARARARAEGSGCGAEAAPAPAPFGRIFPPHGKNQPIAAGALCCKEGRIFLTKGRKPPRELTARGNN